MGLVVDTPLFLLDANACNARQQIEELNELERLADVGKIELMYTESTWNEARFGSEERRTKVDRRYFLGLDEFGENASLVNSWRKDIGQVVFPRGVVNERQRRDIEALLVVKISGGYFVSNDGGSNKQPGGVLGNRDALASCGIKVFSFAEALRHAIALVPPVTRF